MFKKFINVFYCEIVFRIIFPISITFLRDILLDHESFSFIYFGSTCDVLKLDLIYAGHTQIVKSS